MVLRSHPVLPLVALLTVVGSLPAGEALRPLPTQRLAAIRQQQPDRIALLGRSLEAEKCSLGLGMLDGLKVANQTSDVYGRTHVRFHQTYQGVEVFNGGVLGHVDAEGRVLPSTANVQKGIDLQPATMLDEASIRRIVSGGLPVKDQPGRISMSLVVFPTRYQDGLKLKRSAEASIQLDPDFSVTGPRRTDPYCWAYRVHVSQRTDRGPVFTEFVVDAQNGQVLKKWDGSQHLLADIPAVGTGNSQYNGTVQLDTMQLGADGKFTLRDPKRGSKPWPNMYGYPEISGPGNQVVAWDPSGPNSSTSGTSAFLNDTNVWGDGHAFDPFADLADLLAPRGQTAAVDAQYAIATTWDYYQNVLGRVGGIDGKDTSVLSIVHRSDGPQNPIDNASWSDMEFIMQYGDGAPTGALTSLDVAAHEVSHGVMSSTAKLDGMGYESAALNEANSDIHATMVRYYAWGADATGSTVPATTTKAPGDRNTWDFLWTLGTQISEDGETPARWLYKPSKDGLSYDAWFDGMAIDDAHFAMGPGSRAFFFLAQGASSDSTKDTYSPYLPAGMTGLGNDTAIRIWYNGMAAHVEDSEAGYQAIREAMIASATELHPGSGSSDSPEVAAVKNAFAAINVGGPANGAEPVRISFPARDNEPLAYKPILVVPALQDVQLPNPKVENASDTSVTWDLGGLTYLHPLGGRFDDGKFYGPVVSRGGAFPVKATSKADPTRFAVDLVYVVSLDLDNDFDVDACDMGALAFDYWTFTRYPSANIWGMQMGFSEEVSIELFLQGFNNAYNQ
jgi:Zn-dependent metalloprotease